MSDGSFLHRSLVRTPEDVATTWARAVDYEDANPCGQCVGAGHGSAVMLRDTVGLCCIV